MSRWTTRRFLGAGILALTLVLPVVALAVPAFTVLDLGLGVPIDISATGRILGQDAYSNSVPWVLDGGTKTYLPLPPGVATATASRISANGVVVGQVANQPAIWRPKAGGGYELQLLAFPLGATIGRAIAVNTSQVVLVFGTPFTSPTGMLFITYKPYSYALATGALVDLTTVYTVSGTSFPDPVDITDAGRVLLTSGEILEPLSAVVTPAPPFPPRPPGGPSWTFFRAARLNAAGGMVGVATLSCTNCAQVVKHTPDQGWKVLGGLSLNVSAQGITDPGDTLLFANYICPINYGLAYAVDGGSTYCLDDLLLSPGWSYLSFSSKGAVSSTGTIAALGYSYAAGAYRLSLLTPAGDLPVPDAVTLTATPHPGTWTQPYDAITLTWTSGGPLAKQYAIERLGPGETAFTEIARIGATVTQYDDQAIQSLATYRYRVRAIGLAGAGPYSPEATAQAPPPMDRTAPTAAITSPGNGATVTGSVTVGATFTDNVGVTYAQLSFEPNMGNGVICTRAPASPAASLSVSCKWDTTKVAYQSPTATVTAYAQDALGNWVSTAIAVNVTYGTKGGRPRK